MNVITRFAPSPTGRIHIGNARVAIVNWLFSRQNFGKFILRIDDTNREKCDEIYKSQIYQDIKWLGLNFDETFCQSEQIQKYSNVLDLLIKSGRLYPCFETEEELEIKRSIAYKNNKPFIYDRAAIKLTESQKNSYISSSRKCHYRFLLTDQKIEWNDMIKGHISYESRNISDPIVVKQNGDMTYLLCSAIDDVDSNISHIIRGEDHITNTAIQMQMFEALSSVGYEVKIPSFAHLSLIKSSNQEKISKRVGGFEISDLRDNLFLESITINSFLAFLGSSKNIMPYKNMNEILDNFDLESYSKNSTTYVFQDLLDLNRKVISRMEYSEIKDFLQSQNIEITEDFWLAIRNNIKVLHEIKTWYKACYEYKAENISSDIGLAFNLKSYATVSLDHLVDLDIDNETFDIWIDRISKSINKKGKDLFMPLRIILTGMKDGPELRLLIQLIGKQNIIERLNFFIK